LNLSDDQRAQIKMLMDEERAQADAQSPGRKLMDLQRALTAAVFADAPDVSQIDQLRASIAEAEAAVLARRVDLQLKAAQILTPEQRQRARALSAQAAGRKGQGRAAGPAGRRGGKAGANDPATRL
jgi:Spy/CpxP family protein refolding chaperone